MATAFGIGTGAELLKDSLLDLFERDVQAQEMNQAMVDSGFSEGSGDLLVKQDWSSWNASADESIYETPGCMAIRSTQFRQFFESRATVALGTIARNLADEGISAEEIAWHLMPASNSANGSMGQLPQVGSV